MRIFKYFEVRVHMKVNVKKPPKNFKLMLSNQQPSALKMIK